MLSVRNPDYPYSVNPEECDSPEGKTFQEKALQARTVIPADADLL